MRVQIHQEKWEARVPSVAAVTTPSKQHQAQQAAAAGQRGAKWSKVDVRVSRTYEWFVRMQTFFLGEFTVTDIESSDVHSHSRPCSSSLVFLSSCPGEVWMLLNEDEQPVGSEKEMLSYSRADIFVR